MESVYGQEYPTLEVVLIDDTSTDSSRKVIDQLSLEFPEMKVILNDENVGVCKSFNKGLALCTGDYIIDLAGDDYLLPGKISQQVKQLNTLSDDYGMVYSDLIFVDSQNQALNNYKTQTSYPVGNVFLEVLKGHCIYACTMMVKRSVLDVLEGYDESLAYEDFDFLLRVTKKWKVDYLNEPTIAKRELANSLGKQVKKSNNKLTTSTLLICQRLKAEVISKEEKSALKLRLWREAKEAIKNRNWKMGMLFLKEWF